MSKTNMVEVTIVYHKGSRLALMASERPLQVEAATGILATGQMVCFAPEVEGGEGRAMSLDRAFAPAPGNAQKETLSLEAVDGLIANPAGAQLAALQASGVITVHCSTARLPDVRRDFKPRTDILKQADRDAGIGVETDEIAALRQRLTALEGARA